MSEPKKISWADIEEEIKNVINETLHNRLKNNCTEDSQESKDKSINEAQFDVNEKAEKCFVYAVFKDHVCFGKFVNMKFCDKFKNDNKLSQNGKNELLLNDKNKINGKDNLLELRVFNKCFEVRVIYSFEKDEFLYRYLDDYNESNNLYIYPEQHYLDGEWQGDEFKSRIRSLPKLPFLKDENNEPINIDTYKGKDLKLLIKTYIKFDGEGSPEVEDWRLAGFIAGENEEVECCG